MSVYVVVVKRLAYMEIPRISGGKQDVTMAHFHFFKNKDVVVGYVEEELTDLYKLSVS